MQHALAQIARHRAIGERNRSAVGGWGNWRGRFIDFEPYFQDDWKVSRRLTLNLGFRYQYRTSWHDASHPTVDADFIPSQYNPASEAQLNASGYFIPGTGHNYTTYGNGLVQCGVGGVPVGCLNNYYDNFGPRFGFAFDPKGDGKTAIREFEAWEKKTGKHMAGVSARVSGHADPRGDSDYNMTLGQSRADSVAGYMRSKGMDKSKTESTSLRERRAASWRFCRTVRLRNRQRESGT